jgi:hypothetical protein
MRRLLATLPLLLLAVPTLAAPPIFLPVQGVLRAQGGGPVADGAYTLTFRLYAAADAKDALWTEIHADTAAQGGGFQVKLGDGSIPAPLPKAAFLADAPPWLGVQVSKEPELPRVRLDAVPFAVRAHHADTAETLTKPIPGALVDKGAIGSDHIAAGAVQGTHAAFAYAASATKGGAASDVACTGCVGKDDLDPEAVAAHLPVAAADKLGGVKVGAGLQIGQDGVLGLAGAVGAWKVSGDLQVAGKATVDGKLTLGGGFECTGCVGPAALQAGAYPKLDAGLLGGKAAAEYALVAGVPKLQSKTATLKDGETLTLKHGAKTFGLLALGWWKDDQGAMRPVPLETVYSGLSADPALVGRWSFDGCDAKDSSAALNHGETLNSPKCVTGKYGKAFEFNGSSQYVRVPHSKSLDIGGGNLTYGVWAYRTGGPDHAILLNKETLWESAWAGGQLVSAIAPGSPSNWSWQGSGTFPSNQWVHMVVVWNGATVKHYVNGSNSASYGLNGTLASGPCDLGIGARGIGCGGAGSHWTGMLDDAFVFKRALTDGEVQAIAANQWGGGQQTWALKQADNETVTLTNQSGTTSDVVLSVLTP